MYNVDHPVFPKLQAVGKEITTKVKPEAIVVFSAHWQASEKDKIEINTDENAPLIYDFYGFPDHYYKETFPNVGSKKVAAQVTAALTSHGIDVESAKRGLDHGVWAGFKVAFDPDENPLNVPIVQVSLFSSESPSQHYDLGRAIASLRSQNIVIIAAGMAVHNLRDIRKTFENPRPLPYTSSFDEALKDATTSPPGEREQRMVALTKRPDARQAHPTFEHLLPAYVAAGAAGEDLGTQLWTLTEGSVSWAQYRFGDVK
ncbi:hypothetical protein ACLMJK_000981 [Lecanora helva]